MVDYALVSEMKCREDKRRVKIGMVQLHSIDTPIGSGQPLGKDQIFFFRQTKWSSIVYIDSNY